MNLNLHGDAPSRLSADHARQPLAPAQHCLVDTRHPRRAEVEAFIAGRFLDVHGARVTTFMPTLLAFEGPDGNILAALGVRSAGMEPLYLEHYLDYPVERVLADKAGLERAPCRDRIAEIGNLASIDRRASRGLFAILSVYLAGANYDWAVFTGCGALTGLFARLGIGTVNLGRALQARLPVEEQTWGGYYEDNPQVVAGRVSRGRAVFDGPQAIEAGLMS